MCTCHGLSTSLSDYTFIFSCGTEGEERGHIVEKVSHGLLIHGGLRAHDCFERKQYTSETKTKSRVIGIASTISAKTSSSVCQLLISMSVARMTTENLIINITNIFKTNN